MAVSANNWHHHIDYTALHHYMTFHQVIHWLMRYTISAHAQGVPHALLLLQVPDAHQPWTYLVVVEHSICVLACVPVLAKGHLRYLQAAKQAD